MVVMLQLPKLAHLQGQKQFRIIPSVYPAINFFEQLVEPEEMEALWEIESLTNERIRQDRGDIFLVRPEDYISGPGASVVMAAFTHIYQPSRFTNGSFGIYYAGLSQATAIKETVYHRENFLRYTHEEPGEISMRLYEGDIIKNLHDIRGKAFNAFHHAHDYSKSQEFGRKLRQTTSWGLVYRSVRQEGGYCIAAFRPPAVSIPRQISHLRYVWNGEKITDVFATQAVSVF